MRVIVSKGAGASLQAIKDAAIDQLTLTPEQQDEVTNIGAKPALVKWLTDNGHEVADEATITNRGTLPTLMQADYELKYAHVENEAKESFVQGFVSSIAYSEESQAVGAGGGGFAVVNIMIGRKNVSLNVPVEQLVVPISSGAFGVNKETRGLFAGFLTEVRDLRKIAGDPTAARTALRAKIGAAIAELQLSPDYVTINARVQVAGKTTWYKEIGEATEIDTLKAEYAGANVSVVKAVRDSRAGDTFTFRRGQEVVGVLVYHATDNYQLIGMSLSNKQAFESTHGNVVAIATDVNKALAFANMDSDGNVAVADIVRDVQIIEYLMSLPATTRNMLLNTPKYSAYREQVETV